MWFLDYLDSSNIEIKWNILQQLVKMHIWVIQTATLHPIISNSVFFQLDQLIANN